METYTLLFSAFCLGWAIGYVVGMEVSRRIWSK